MKFHHCWPPWKYSSDAHVVQCAAPWGSCERKSLTDTVQQTTSHRSDQDANDVMLCIECSQNLKVVACSLLDDACNISGHSPIFRKLWVWCVGVGFTWNARGDWSPFLKGTLIKPLYAVILPSSCHLFVSINKKSGYEVPPYICGNRQNNRWPLHGTKEQSKFATRDVRWRGLGECACVGVYCWYADLEPTHKFRSQYGTLRSGTLCFIDFFFASFLTCASPSTESYCSN